MVYNSVEENNGSRSDIIEWWVVDLKKKDERMGWVSHLPNTQGSRCIGSAMISATLHTSITKSTLDEVLSPCLIPTKATRSPSGEKVGLKQLQPQ